MRGKYLDKGGELPRAVMEWSGIRCQDGGAAGSEQTLMRRNDTGHTFEEIADFIEANWGAL